MEPRRDNAREHGRTPSGAFCWGGQVNMGPEIKSGPAQWAKIGLRTDAGKSRDLYCEELKEHRSSPSPSNCCSLSPNCCPKSHQEHEPQRLGSHPASLCCPCARANLLYCISYSTLDLGHHQTRHLEVPGETGVASGINLGDGLESYLFSLHPPGVTHENVL